MAFKKLFYISGLIGVFAVMSAKSASAEPVRVGTYQFQPYFITDNIGETTGVWIDTLEEILELSGFEARFESFPPPRLVKNMILGRTDLTISARHIAVNEHVYYSTKPVGQIYLNTYQLKGNKSPQNIADLKGKRVIVIRGYAYNGRISELRDPTNNITTIEATTHEDALHRLKNGNGDYLLNYRNPIEKAMRAENINPDLFKATSIDQYPVFYMVSRRAENALSLMKAINEHMK